MSTPILATKLYVLPPRPTHVPRPHLIERLNQGLQFGHKLTLVSAPAGFGKTTLVSEWVGSLRSDAAIASENRIAWLSLDENDNDPTRFLTYFIAALSQVEGIETSIGKEAMGMLQSRQPPAVPVLTSLINDITALSDRIILILDDYHLINSSTIGDALTFLLEHLPPQMHLVIATREDPHLPLSRLRARGQLTELRAANLRFTCSEAAEFLNRVMGLTISEEDVNALETRTEGWIAGLQLAAISLQGHSDTSRQIQSFTGSHRFVLDYLLEEVLGQQPESVQTFLLQTSILDRLTGSLCDSLTGKADGQTTLEMLESANLFIVSLDNERRWYRYHHLFADLLRQRLHQTQLERLPILHNRAIEWYEQYGFTDEAIEHALRAQAFERAAHLIESVAESIWLRSEHGKLGRWLEGLPVKLVYSRPHLCILQAGYLFASGQQDEAERSLQVAEQALDRNGGRSFKSSRAKQDQKPGTESMKLLGRVAATRSFMASYRSDALGVISHAQRALDFLPEQDITWRGATAVALGDAYIYKGDYFAAHRAYLGALKAIEAAGDIYLFMNVSLKQALTLRAQGRLRQTMEICQQRLQLANERGMSQTEMVGWLLAIWGEVLAETNDLEGATDLVRKGVGLTERGGDVAMLGWSYLCQIRVLFCRGDLAGAEAITRKMENINRENIVPLWITNQMAAWQTRIWLAQDKLEAASQWVLEQGLNPNRETTYVGELEHIALARILIYQGRLDDSTKLLRRLLKSAEAGGHILRAIEILILQALTFRAGGETNQALSALERAFTLAEPEGFVRIFVDEGPPMAHLLHEAVARGIAPDYARRLLSAFTVDEAERSDLSETQTPNSQLVEPLSERELEVLQLIADGFTNREIADRLYLSLNTVKVHTRNIYGKLGVHNRMQAVAAARALGVISPN